MSFASVWKDLKTNATEGMNGVIGAYATGVENWAQAQAEQIGARFTPTVDYQNKGDPVSVKVQEPARELVGDKEAQAAKSDDKKMLYVAGGALVLVAVVGLVIASRK